MCNSHVIHSNTLYTNFNEEIILIYFFNLNIWVGKIRWSTFCGWWAFWFSLFLLFMWLMKPNFCRNLPGQ